MKFNRITILAIAAIITIVFGTLVINIRYGDGYKEPVDASTTSKFVEPSTTAPASTTTTTEEPTTTSPPTTTTTTTAITTKVVTAAPVVTTTRAVTSPPVVTIPAKPKTVKPKPVKNTASSITLNLGDSAMLSAVNAERARAGKNALVMNKSLCNCAGVRAKEIATSFSHTRPNGTSCFTVLSDGGVNYTACGENLAKGQASVTNVMNDWMNSSGHRDNILSVNHDYNSFGCACYSVGGVNYWVQEFAYIP